METRGSRWLDNFTAQTLAGLACLVLVGIVTGGIAQALGVSGQLVYLYSFLSIVVILLLVLLVLLWRDITERKKTRTSADVPLGGSNGILFYAFGDFQRAFDIGHAFDAGNKAYAFWLSGAGILEVLGVDRVLKSGTIQRLLLPDPDCDELRSLLSTLGQEGEHSKYKQQILRTTELAKNNVHVRWTNRFYSFQVTLVNPEHGECWAHFELTLPYSTMHQRVFGRMEGENSRALIRNLFAWHGKIWDDPTASWEPGNRPAVISPPAVGTQKSSSGLKTETPPLLVSYEDHTGSFYQESPIQQAGLGRGVLQLARIKLTGLSRDPIADVQVKVQQVIPEQERLHGLPFHVHRMNDNTPPYQRSTVFSKDQQEYFDVVGYSRFMISTGRLHFRRIDGKEALLDEVPCDFLVTITALGRDRIDCWFRVWVDNDNNLRMTWRDMNQDAIKV